MPMTTPAEILCFGEFELDRSAYELRRKGRRVKLGRQPMDLLIFLVERPRQLVSRTEIVERLWGADVFVDIETGVNSAISKVRQALRDSADAPASSRRLPARAIGSSLRSRLASSRRLPSKPRYPLLKRQLPLSRHHSSFRRSLRRHRPARSRRNDRLVCGSDWWRRVSFCSPSSGAWPRVSLVAAVHLRRWVSLSCRLKISAAIPNAIPGGRTDRRDERVAGAGRSSASQRQGADGALQGDHEDGGRDRAGARSGVSGRELTTGRRQPVAGHRDAHSHGGSAACLVAVLRSGVEGSAGAAAGVERRHCRSDSPAAVARSRCRHRPASDPESRGLRRFSARRFQRNRRTADGNARAVELYKRAIALDPDYALAWADLSFTYSASSINSDARPRTVRPLAREAADRAVRANPSLSEAQQVSGYERWLLEWDWREAESRLRTAIDLDPSNGQASRSLGHVLSQAGRDDEAEAAMARARELEPTDVLAYALSSQVAAQARHFDGAIEHARRAILLDPQFWIGHIMLGNALDSAGEPELALEALAQAGSTPTTTAKCCRCEATRWRSSVVPTQPGT